MRRPSPSLRGTRATRGKRPTDGAENLPGMPPADTPADRSARRARREATLRSRRAPARSRRRKWLFVGGAPLVLVAILVAVLIANETVATAGLVDATKLNPGGQLLSTGTRAPNFTLPTADGKRYTLSAFRGKPVLLEFFAVWCPHCQRESTVLNQIDRQFEPRGLQTLAILANPYGKNYDNSGGNDLSIATKSDIAWFEQTFGVTHPTLIDPTFTTVNAYNAGSYPTIYVLDKQGIIRYANSGEQPYATLAQAITTASK